MRQLYYSTDLCILGPIIRMSNLEAHQLFVTEEVKDTGILVGRSVL